MLDGISRPEAVGDRELKRLRNLCLTWGMDNAPRFSTWLHSWVDAEQAIRATGGERSHEHLLSAPSRVAEWSDKDLAQTLGMVMSLHFSRNQTEELGRLVDRWVVLVAHAASSRLLGLQDAKPDV